ncbi:MAG: hypothetical protein AAGB04_29640 [Pseudomonadota bacterium]
MLIASNSHALNNGEEWRLLNKEFWLENCSRIRASLKGNADVLDDRTYRPWKFATNGIDEFIGPMNELPATEVAKSTISVAQVHLPTFGATKADLNFFENDKEVIFSQVSENDIVMTIRISPLEVVEDMFAPPSERPLQTAQFAELNSVELTQKVFGSPTHVSKLRRDSFSISIDHIRCSPETVYEDLRAYLLFRLKQYEPPNGEVFELQYEEASGFLSLYQRSKYNFAEVVFIMMNKAFRFSTGLD